MLSLRDYSIEQVHDLRMWINDEFHGESGVIVVGAITFHEDCDPIATLVKWEEWFSGMGSSRSSGSPEINSLLLTDGKILRIMGVRTFQFGGF